MSLRPARSDAQKMTIDIDFKTASMSVDDSGAIPAIGIGPRHAVVHLTQGFNGPEANRGAFGDAFTITGEVDVLVDSNSEVNDVLNGRWLFTFMQVRIAKSYSSTWSGRRDTEGEIDFEIVDEVVWPKDKQISLDTAPSIAPFTISTKHSGFVKGSNGNKIIVHVKNSMGDHPNQGSILIAPNKMTKASNFLRKMETERDFYSAFIARDDLDNFMFIAHIHWGFEQTLA